MDIYSAYQNLEVAWMFVEALQVTAFYLLQKDSLKNKYLKQY